MRSLTFVKSYACLTPPLCLPVEKVEVQNIDPCNPSPCGPNSQCRSVNGHAVCSCKTGYIGTPPSCKPECVVSADCPQDRACLTQKCRDPCPGVCGSNARCNVVNHNPICSCTPGHTGDPFVRCIKEERKHAVNFLSGVWVKQNWSIRHPLVKIANQFYFAFNLYILFLIL